MDSHFWKLALLATAFELGVLGEGGVSARLAAEGLLSVLREVSSGLLVAQDLGEYVVEHDVSQRELVAHSEALAAKRRLDASHPPGQVASGLAVTTGHSSDISSATIEPLVQGLLSGLLAPGHQAAEGLVHLLQVLDNSKDLSTFQVISAHETVLSSNIIINGNRLANVIVTNLHNGHATQVGSQVAGGLVISSVSVITLQND